MSAEFQNDLPLKGQRILVTREEGPDHSLSESLIQFGAQVHIHPLISIQPPDSWDSFDQQINHINQIDWLVFTSRNGVIFTFQRLAELNLSNEIFQSLRIACIGPATAEALLQEGLETDMIPGLYQSEGLIQEFQKMKSDGLCFWLVQAEAPRSILQEELIKMNAEVVTSTVYCNRMPQMDFSPLLELIRLKKLDWIVFASASAVKNLCSIIPQEWGKTWSSNLKVACLGEITKNTALEQGLNVEVQPEVQNFEHLATAISDYVSKQGRRI